MIAIKIDDLLKSNDFGAYIIGNIFAFQYKYKHSFISLFSSKEQKTTNHFIKIEKFYDLITRIEKYYQVSIQKYYFEITKNENIQKKLKNQIGLFTLVNLDYDPNFNLENFIFKKLKLKNEELSKTFSLNFIRGVVDARSSPDTTTAFIAMDIKKQTAITFVAIMDKAFENVFGFDKQKYNINPRFSQPKYISKIKNPQFRIPYTIVFGSIGTFRTQYLEKLQKHKSGLWEKFQNNTNIPNYFNNLIKWDTSNIPYTPRVNNIKKIKNDVEFLNQYKVNTNDINNKFYQNLKLSDIDVCKKIPVTKGRKIDSITKIEVLKKCNYGDFLEPNKEIEKNKYNKPLLDVHHIIPYKFSWIFLEKSSINDVNNLITLRQDTHYFLHRGQFNDIKIQYLKKLYNSIKAFLTKEKVRQNISFEDFRKMY